MFYFPIHGVIAHTRIARTRCMTGVQPNLALVEWRAVQMHRYRNLRFAWIPNLVISESKRRDSVKRGCNAVDRFLLGIAPLFILYYLPQ